jgi:oligoendopeptidase F
MKSTSLPTRDKIETRYKWNRESLFESPPAWETAFDRAYADIDSFAADHAGFDHDADALLTTLDDKFALLNRVEHVLLYAALEYSVDSADDTAAGRSSRARSLLAQARAAISFLEPGILQIGLDVLESWMGENPSLETYRHYLEDLFRKAEHYRSAEIENLMGLVSDPFASVSSTMRALTDSDMLFGEARARDGSLHPVTQGTVSGILTRADRSLRQDAWERYFNQYAGHKHTLTSNLEASTKQAVFTSRVRRHDSTLDAALFPHAIPTSVFFNLLETFQRNLPIWHRYFRLRKRLLGVEQLELYDVWAPLTDSPPTVPYEQAVEWICAGLAPLGEDYVETVRRGALEDRWIDALPNQGKRQGAFSWGSPGTHPFIVMSYDDTLFRLSTLAHELGHSMHSYLAWQTQPLAYCDYSLFVAEVASNMHQALVRSYLFDTQSDPDFQIALIEEALSNFHRYLLQMPTLARFEVQMHQDIEAGLGLTVETMVDRMASMLSEAYGEAMHIDKARAGMTWATFGHLYVHFYVFQYSTGIAAAQALAKRVIADEPGARQGYLEFLRAGGSLHPLQALKLAGIDLSSPQPIEEAFLVLESMIERLEELTA